MKKIVVASKNPVKVAAALGGFRQLFPQEAFEAVGIAVPSGVSEQPFSDAETLQGAVNRTNAVYTREPDADFWLGIEGGIEDWEGEMATFAWVVARSRTHIGKGKSGTFFLPPAVVDLVKQGMELGQADDLVFGMTNSKQANGAVGILTDNAMNRTELYRAAVVLALIPLRNTGLYLPM